MKTFQLQSEEVMMIGDAVFDIQMANAAHVDSCAVTWGSHQENQLKAESPTMLIRHVADLEQL
ncbi:hypothetical protein GCM10011391_14500 [Pullulanibacillus camelliae]|uniref:HAD family hydrolase n=1 Tax=Pullulanibacillus camelliae TaxID=1707096 RepID=A0A8J2YG47_9BACL|nr:hypothetical protein GCM10011391_14500 [Pullulanibacillus camelliae]